MYQNISAINDLSHNKLQLLPGPLNAGTADCSGPSCPSPGGGRSPSGISREVGSRGCPPG